MSKLGLILISIFMLLVPQVKAQTKPENQSLAQRAAAEHETAVIGGVEEPRERLQQELISRAIAERQLRLRHDTEKLLALAAELKQNVDKTGPNILSLDVIKKAQEIEKLAKSVKDKMRDAY
jgi:spore coat polysaccharide biosynthesis protein SpsF (cytidylyltransferase family)